MKLLRRLQRVFSRTPNGNTAGRSLGGVQSAIEYRFSNPDLLVKALIHRSYSYDADTVTPDSSNERLEFLGDAVLSLVVNEYLYERYPQKREGELTKMKSVIVSKAILARYARRNNLGSFVLLSENAQRGKVAETDSVLANTLEAVFGAVFLDGGFPAAGDCIRRMLLSDLNDIFYDEENINYKSLLQEYIQALHKVPPKYRVSSTRGPEHDKEFAVEVGVRGKVLATGVGKTKKLAEQEAARAAYKKLLNTEGIAREQEADR